MAVSDYVNRKFDVVAFRGAQAAGDRQLTQSLFESNPGSSIDDSELGGEVVTGIQKLAQRWALEFLTIRGSMGFHLSNRGSDFLNYLKNGRIRTEYDVQSYFHFAANQVYSNLINEQTGLVAEEQLKRADVDQIKLYDGTLELAVTITSQAGSNRTIILPISIVPTNLNL